MHRLKKHFLVALLAIGLMLCVIPRFTPLSLVHGESGNTSIYAPVHHNVTVYRDDWGVPHIYAEKVSDAYYALGYVMAQDRMFEMDLFRRAVAGRLSEIFGGDMLEQDMLMRTLGIYKIGEDTLSEVYGPIPEDVIENLEQFANGVNRYIAEWVVPDDVPTEYRALFLSFPSLTWEDLLPYNWTAADSIAIAGMMGLQLTDTSEGELIRGGLMQAEMLGALPAGTTDFLMPTGWINMTTIMPPDCPYYESLGIVKAITDPLKNLFGLPSFLGSNNWVVNETMSATGNAMLCNDPHLDLQTPGINWQVHIKTNEFNVIGVCIPGGPVVYSGHNDHIAWGVTNFMADVLDLYYYVLDNPFPFCTQYWYIDHWEPLTVRFETILNVTTPITIPVFSTRHGPLLNIPGVGTYAFRWSGHEKGFGEVVGFTRVMNATNLAEWRQALSHMTVIIQNYVYADKLGNIAYCPSGAIPIRHPGPTPRATMGVVPSNGSAGENEWMGYIPHSTSPVDFPFDPWPFPVSLPYSENPKQGFIATANNQPIGPGYPGYPWPVWIGPACGFDPGYRAERITELITSLAPLTIDGMIAIQGDSLSIPARNFVPYILGVCGGDPNATIQQALGYLAAWNFTELRTSVAALIFEVWYDKFEYNTFADEFGPYGLFPFPNVIIPLWNMTQTYPTNFFAVLFFDDKTTPSLGPGQPGWETMMDIINASLYDAIEYLINRLGPNMATWQYGALHVVQFDHPMGEVVPYFSVPPNPPYGPGPVPCDGGPYTVDPGGHFHKLIVGQAYLYVDSGASYRGIYECKDDWDTSLILVPPGESGLVTGVVLAPIFSPHYADTFLMWLNNLYTPCLFNDAIIQTYSKIVFYRFLGDVNYDRKVNIRDVALAAIAFGSYPGHPRWPDNPWIDTNEDGKINIRDIALVAKEFGKEAPA